MRESAPSWAEGIRVYDIVPIILDFLGLDIPENTDGKVIDLSSVRALKNE